MTADRPRRPADPEKILDSLGAVWSPDADAFFQGKQPAGGYRCALCQHAPCDCPPFGTPEYHALTDRRHGRKPSPSGTPPPPVTEHPDDPVTGGATVRGHQRTLPSGKVVRVRQHKRQVDRAQPESPAGPPQPAAPRPKLVQPAPAPPRGARPPLKPRPEARPRTRPATRPEPVTRRKRKHRGPLVSRAHAAKLARRAVRHAQRRHRRGKAVAYGALALGEMGAVAGLQGVGLVLASVAAVAGVIATLAFKGSSYR